MALSLEIKKRNMVSVIRSLWKIGLDKLYLQVQAQWELFCMAYNIQKLTNYGQSAAWNSIVGIPGVAYAALYLASEEPKYVIGIELNVDGGILAGSSPAPSQ